MNNKNEMVNIKNKGGQEMVKYIVEASAPKKGQIVSSGGVRENGKLVTQFKNPVLYKEPQATVVQNNSMVGRTKPTLRGEIGNAVQVGLAAGAENVTQTIAKEMAYMIWNKLGKPWLSKLIDRIRSKEPAVDWMYAENKRRLAQEETEPMADNTKAATTLSMSAEPCKVIQFPKRDIG